MTIPRHKTAIRRLAHSRPVSLALNHGLVGPDATFFDYGCGYGEDIDLLRSAGVHAEGWDPYYRSDSNVCPADCVNLGYVLNVIDDVSERDATLRLAFGLAKYVLIVAVRVDQSLSGGIDYSDGVVTNSGSFQKIYTQAEFRDYVAVKLGRKPFMAGLGIAYVFKDEAAESALLARVSRTQVRSARIDWLSQLASDADGKALIDITRQLGRIPLDSEFDGYERLAIRFGCRSRIERLAFAAVGSGGLAEAQLQKRNDILTYLAMLHLRGIRPPPVGSLPSEVRADIKLWWRSYTKAIDEGREFLFQLGNPEQIRAACGAAPVGKRLPMDLYVHSSSEDMLPALLRVLIFAARQVVGDVEYNIVKLSMDGRKVSFLQYQDFDQDAHPCLRHSVRVHLPTASYMIRDYRASENPPILHRKETLVDPVYPLCELFTALSEQEEALGLLSQSSIGFRQQWQQLLAEQKVEIIGHSIRNVSNDREDSTKGELQ